MKKVFIKSTVAVFLSLIILLLGLAYWLLKPFDSASWRVKLHMPLIGTVQLRGYPLLQLATSLAGQKLLNKSHWQSSHGELQLLYQTGALTVNCKACTVHIPALSQHPVQFDRLSLTVQHRNQSVSGFAEMQSGAYVNQIHYTGQADMQGVSLNWSLPRTPLSTLIQPLKNHSVVLQKAHLYGTLLATGKLQWPSRSWSIKPELQEFEVTGLATERLKKTTLNYHCPTTSTNMTPASSHWVTEKKLGPWLPKAVLITEDAGFWEHPGYNMVTLRFLLAQENHSKTPGGSTLTQQLVKYSITGSERNWLRKLEELLYAVEMEKTLGKRLILSWYLNTVDWGPSICGAAQAANVYFGRKPAQLSAVQSAWLAGIIRNPHRAWHQEYLPQTPDLKRLRWIMGYMPKKARHSRYELKFAKPKSSNVPTSLSCCRGLTQSLLKSDHD